MSTARCAFWLVLDPAVLVCCLGGPALTLTCSGIRIRQKWHIRDMVDMHAVVNGWLHSESQQHLQTAVLLCQFSIILNEVIRRQLPLSQLCHIWGGTLFHSTACIVRFIRYFAPGGCF